MHYENPVVDAALVPQAVESIFQHVVDTYASETNKTAATWRQFSDEDLNWKPHEKSATVGEIMRHQILSERRFFSEFLGHSEPAVNTLLPEVATVESLTKRFAQLAVGRLPWLARISHRAAAKRKNTAPESFFEDSWSAVRFTGGKNGQAACWNESNPEEKAFLFIFRVSPCASS